MPKATLDSALRRQLAGFLSEAHAHADFDTAIKAFPAKLRGKKPAGSPHTAWQLLEHMRIAQWDILEFSRDARHVSPKWPEGYWPDSAEPPSDAAWNASVRRFRADRKVMQKLIADPKRDLFARIPQGDDQTLLREALLVLDHNAYHLGQFLLLRKMLGTWPD